jgi:hypothetical protein
MSVLLVLLMYYRKTPEIQYSIKEIIHAGNADSRANERTWQDTGKRR